MTDDSISKQEKLDLAHRLQREGYWPEAELRRDELRHEGFNALQVWEALDKEFPPLDAEEPPVDDYDDMLGADTYENFPGRYIALMDLVEEFDKSGDGIDTVRDMRWVEAHQNDDVGPQDAPSPGAWDWRIFTGLVASKFLKLNLQITREFGRAGWKAEDRQTKQAMRRVLACLDDQLSDS